MDALPYDEQDDQGSVQLIDGPAGPKEEEDLAPRSHSNTKMRREKNRGKEMSR
jgi:hypothetical protein